MAANPESSPVKGTKKRAAGSAASKTSSPAHLTKKPMARALAISIKKADTSGRIMNAVGAAPYALVTAVILAMAVGVAPRLMPLKPEAITAAR